MPQAWRLRNPLGLTGGLSVPEIGGMSPKPPKSLVTARKMRLAKALRANLLRRKAQAKRRKEAPREPKP